MLRAKPMLKLMMLCGATIAISGCVSSQKAAPVAGADCGAYQIIRPSRQDTLDTKRQVLAHNSVYRKLCEGK
jgi:hypothetical protein